MAADRWSGSIDQFIFIGAGASYGARLDSPLIPPQGDDLASYLLGWLESNDPARWSHEEQILAQDERFTDLPLPCDMLTQSARRKALREWLVQASGEPRNKRTKFETTMQRLWVLRDGSTLERWLVNVALTPAFIRLLGSLKLFNPAFDWMNRRTRLIGDLNWLLAWSLTTGKGLAFTEGVDEYDALFRMYDGQSLALISLNYDLLAEEALVRLRGDDGIWFPGVRFGQEQKSLPVFKLHGSCNWLTLPNHQIGSGENWQPDPSQPALTTGPEGTFDTQHEHAFLSSRPNVVAHLKHSYGVEHPVMALFTGRKPAPWNWPAINKTRQLCLMAISRNPKSAATIVGVRIPDDPSDDSDLVRTLECLGRLEGTRLFVNPDSEQCEKAEAFGLEPRQVGVAEFVASAGC